MRAADDADDVTTHCTGELKLVTELGIENFGCKLTLHNPQKPAGGSVKNHPSRPTKPMNVCLSGQKPE